MISLPVQNQIEIERARRHRVGPRPAPLFFDLQQAIQQNARRQLRAPDDRGIQVRAVLGTDADGFRFQK